MPSLLELRIRRAGRIYKWFGLIWLTACEAQVVYKVVAHLANHFIGVAHSTFCAGNMTTPSSATPSAETFRSVRCPIDMLARHSALGGSDYEHETGWSCRS